MKAFLVMTVLLCIGLCVLLAEVYSKNSKLEKDFVRMANITDTITNKLVEVGKQRDSIGMELLNCQAKNTVETAKHIKTLMELRNARIEQINTNLDYYNLLKYVNNQR